MPIGKIHSFQSLGAADGPGVRFIVFLQGCPYRCPYCHNPDTRPFSGGEEYTAEQIIEKVVRFKPYFSGGGGLTVSGGEPLMQADFVYELFRLAHENGINTCIDTATLKPDEKVKKVLSQTDTVLCDVKFTDAEMYEKCVGAKMSDVLEFLALCRDMKINTVVRHVVVPGMTNGEENIRSLKRIVSEICSDIKIELLPFKKLCTQKYKALGIPFPLEDTPECSKSEIEKLRLIVK